MVLIVDSNLLLLSTQPYEFLKDDPLICVGALLILVEQGMTTNYYFHLNYHKQVLCRKVAFKHEKYASYFKITLGSQINITCL